MIALNRAIAIGFRDGYKAGLAELDRLDRDDGRMLSGYHPIPAAPADFLRRLGRTDEALRAYDAALDLTSEDQPERHLLQRRISELRLLDP